MLIKSSKKSFLNWIIKFSRRFIAIFLFRSKSRFIVLTPPIFSKQKIYDHQNKKIFSLSIRDEIDVLVMEQIFVDHDYNLGRLARYSELLGSYQRIIDSGKTPLVIDCGANSGMATLYFKETFPLAHIVSVEPDPSNMRLAKINSKGRENITYIFGAVGNDVCRAELVDPGQGNWSQRVELNQSGGVEMFSVNSILERFSDDSFDPFIIKIDIEGFEHNLFEKNTDWVDKFPLLIMELHDWMLPKQASSRNFLKVIANKNRDFVFFGENVFSISND